MMTSRKIGKPVVRPRTKNTLENWNILSKGFEEIYNHNSSILSFEELYRNAYLMVLHKDGERLYTLLKQFMEEQLLLMLKTIRPFGILKDCEAHLASILSVYKEHSTAIGMIKDVMMYLDRTYCQPRHVMPTYELGLDLFRIKVLDHLKPSILSSFLSLINHQRDGELVDCGLLKDVCGMVQLLQCSKTQTWYDVHLEPSIINSAKEYYTNYSILKLDMDCVVYLELIHEQISLESSFQYLKPQTLEKLKTVVWEHMVGAHVNMIIEKGFVTMVKEKEYKSIDLMFRTLQTVKEGLPALSLKLSQTIDKSGSALNGSKDVEGWIVGLVQLKQEYDKVLEVLPDPMFTNSMNQAFQNVVKGQKRAPQMISYYLDTNLKHLVRGSSSMTSERLLDTVMSVFRYLPEKDIFERFFKLGLAKRLLSRNANIDMEQDVIAGFKNECGSQYTNKMEQMIKDVMVQDSDDDLKKKRVSVMVLTNTIWPLVAKHAYLPPEFLTLQTEFEKLYKARHNGRVLNWCAQLGSVELRCKLQEGEKELSMPTGCAIVLLHCFQTDESIVYSTIKEKTGMDDVELKRILLSLALGKHRLLLKNTEQKSIDETDTFSFNSGFTCPLKKLKIQMMKAVEEEEEKVIQKVVDDRRYVIEACIIRIMKARNVLSHLQLTQEVLELLKINIEMGVIKSRIESLIEREYLKRSDEDRNCYVYIA